MLDFDVSFYQIPLLAVGGYLFLIGLIAFRKATYFGITMLLIGLSILSKDSAFVAWVPFLCMLSAWITFYLYILSFRRNIRIIELLLHATIPTLWLSSIALFDFTEALFQPVYFFSSIVYLLLTLSILYPIHLNQGMNSNFRKVVLIGIVLLLILRIFTPLVTLENNLTLFHLACLILCLYLSSRFIINPDQVFILQKEQATNYEDELKRRLISIIEYEKVYRISDLTLQDLSLRMQMKNQELSIFLNQSIGKSFNDLINEYRIKEVKSLMSDPHTDSKATIIELAYKSGFNSKATFNRVFKQFTGKTPKEFKEDPTAIST